MHGSPGLTNLPGENNCFLNALVQAILYTRPLRNLVSKAAPVHFTFAAVLQHAHHASCGKVQARLVLGSSDNVSSAGNTVLTELRDLLAALEAWHSGGALSPDRLRQALDGFSGDFPLGM